MMMTCTDIQAIASSSCAFEAAMEVDRPLSPHICGPPIASAWNASPHFNVPVHSVPGAVLLFRHPLYVFLRHPTQMNFLA